jgi:hypothetical protein
MPFIWYGVLLLFWKNRKREQLNAAVVRAPIWTVKEDGRILWFMTDNLFSGRVSFVEYCGEYSWMYLFDKKRKYYVQ